MYRLLTKSLVYVIVDNVKHNNVYIKNFRYGVMKMKRILSLTLCALMFLSSALSLFSCADSGNNNATVSAGSNAFEWADNLPEDLNFSQFSDNNVVFVVPKAGPLVANSIAPDEANGDAVATASYKKLRMVETRLGVTIELVEMNEGSSIVDTNVLTALQAGTTDYDVIGGTMLFDTVIPANNNVLVDLSTLEGTDADYIDITQPYWDKAYIDSLSYKGSYFWLMGDIMLSYVSTVYCVYVNGEIYEKYLFSNYGSIYDIVDNGDWTLSLMQEMAGAVFQDTGNVQDEEDVEDILGMVMTHGDPDGLAIGADIRFSTRDSEGNITLSIANDRTVKYIELITEFKNAKGILWPTMNSEDVFASGSALFYSGMLSTAELKLREMDNYYIIPLPKLDKDQEKYRTRLGDWNIMLAINANSEKIAMTAATLEAMASGSYSMVTPIYYDEALKYKYSRDDDTARMIEIIRGSADGEFVHEWGSSFSGLWDYFRNLNGTVTMSALQQSSRIWERELKNLVKKLNNLYFEQ